MGRRHLEQVPAGRTEAGPGVGGRPAVQSGLWVFGASNPARRRRTRKRRKRGKRRSRRTAEGMREARRILGRWRSEGTEPCRVCGGEGGGLGGSRNLEVEEKEQMVKKKMLPESLKKAKKNKNIVSCFSVKQVFFPNQLLFQLYFLVFSTSALVVCCTKIDLRVYVTTVCCLV